MKVKAIHGLSERRACRLVEISRSSYRYKPVEPTDEPIRRRLKELAHKKHYCRYGTPRLTDKLKKEGYRVNHKRIERIYKEEGLGYRRKKAKKKIWGTREPLIELTAPNQEWAMDFVSGSTVTGRKYRILNILDQHTRESLAMEIDTSISSQRVIRVLNRICEEYGYPERIRMDNGPEFTSKAMKTWFSTRGVIPVFIQPGKPKQNAFVESFQGKFRDECLDLYWFYSLHEVREACEEWRFHYNHYRDHSSLGKKPPRDFAAAHAALPSPTAPEPLHESMEAGLSTVVLS